MTHNKFDADAAAATIIENELDLDDPAIDGHPDDVRDAFRAVAVEITQGTEPAGDCLASETEEYWLALYGPGQTSTMAGAIRDALPEQRGDYRDSLPDEYVRVLRQLVTSVGHQAHLRQGDAPGSDQYVLIHVKPNAYQTHNLEAGDVLIDTSADENAPVKIETVHEDGSVTIHVYRSETYWDEETNDEEEVAWCLEEGIYVPQPEFDGELDINVPGVTEENY